MGQDWLTCFEFWCVCSNSLCVICAVRPKFAEKIFIKRYAWNKERYALQSSPEIIRVIKSRRLRWAGHVECMGGGARRGVHRLLVETPQGRKPLGKTLA